MNRGHTLLEVMLAVTVSMIVMVGVVDFFRTGSQSVVKTSDHAAARIEAMQVLEQIGWDLDRLLVGDQIDDPKASVSKPLGKFVDLPQGSSFGFYAFHHREAYRTLKKILLKGHWVDYRVVKQAGGGVDLLRNDRPVNKFPLSDVRLAKLDPVQAREQGLSPEHALTVKIYPRGEWDSGNLNLASEANVQQRTFHLRGVESRYAVLMSLRRVLDAAGQGYPPGYEKLALLPTPPAADADPSAGTVILDWMQPQDLVFLEDRVFDDESADRHLEFPPAPSVTP